MFPCRPGRPGRRRRRVLIVRAGGARLYEGSRVSVDAAAPAVFAADEDGYAALARHAARGRTAAAAAAIHVLVDLVEEDFHRDTVPRVYGRARRSLLAARGARWFRETPYVHVRREGREREGRRDERITLAAVVRPERLDPWLDALRECGAPVAGVHSLPMTSAGLLRHLADGGADGAGRSGGKRRGDGAEGGGADAQRLLLVTESGAEGLRQTLFEDGRLTVSRLAPLPPGAAAERARRAVAEVERLLRHLEHAHRSAGELKVRFVGSEALLAALRETAGAPGGLADGGLVDAAELERRLGPRAREGRSGGRGNGEVRTRDPGEDGERIETDGAKGGEERRSDGDGSVPRGGNAPGRESGTGGDGGDGADRAFVRLVLRRPPPDHYAPPAVTAAYRTRRAGRRIGAGGAAALVASAAWSVAAWQGAQDRSAAARALVREAEAVEARYRAERWPQTPVGIGEVRLAVETVQRLEAGRARVLPLFQAVGAALEGFPDLRLESLEWFEETARDGGGGRVAAQRGEDRRTPEGAGSRFRTVTLRGRVEPFDGHHQAAIDDVYRFGDALAGSSRLSAVEVVDLPRPHGGGGSGGGPQRAGFEMRMTFDVQGE